MVRGSCYHCVAGGGVCDGGSVSDGGDLFCKDVVVVDGKSHVFDYVVDGGGDDV